MGLVRGLVGAVVAVVVGGAGVAAAQQYDLVIRGGRIVDGTGSPWYSGSVAIKDGKIVAILPAGVGVRTEAGPSAALRDDNFKTTAGPSTALRSAQDDNSDGQAGTEAGPSAALRDDNFKITAGPSTALRSAQDDNSDGQAGTEACPSAALQDDNFKTTAGPSTALRSAQDDNSDGQAGTEAGPSAALRDDNFKTTAGPSAALRSAQDDNSDGQAKTEAGPSAALRDDNFKTTAGPSTALRSAQDDNLNGVVARRVIEARGMVVAPGFIDMLGQSERTVLREPHVPSKIFQGITTEITGEGNSIAPRTAGMMAASAAGARYPTHDDKAVMNGAPGMVALRDENSGQGGAVGFRSFAEYFGRLESQGSAINLGSYVGATTVRRMVLGEEDRAPTAAELKQMQGIVREAMREGAMGVSTSLMYAPAPYAKTEELVALAKAAAEEGGIYATHMRSEADGIYAALEETFRIAREAKIPVEIFHLKVAGKGNWGEMPEVVRRIDAARAEGLDVAADTYAYTVSGNPFSAMIPPWAHVGGDAAMVARLKDAGVRARIREAILHDRTWDNEWYMVAGPEGVWISSTTDAGLKALQGKTLAEVAAMRGVDAIDCVMDLLAEDPKMGVLLATMDENDVEEALKQPWVSVGLDASGDAPGASSAGGHPRAYGTFPRILRKYVREDGLLTLPEAIRKFSALPAERMHLSDRGVLKAGMWADVVVFDPAKVRDLATFEQPDQLAVGMEYVLVNGVPVISEGKMTEALPGKVLRGAGYGR